MGAVIWFCIISIAYTRSAIEVTHSNWTVIWFGVILLLCEENLYIYFFLKIKHTKYLKWKLCTIVYSNSKYNAIALNVCGSQSNPTLLSYVLLITAIQ